jgi:hypothetical protein
MKPEFMTEKKAPAKAGKPAAKAPPVAGKKGFMPFKSGGKSSKKGC